MERQEQKLTWFNNLKAPMVKIDFKFSFFFSYVSLLYDLHTFIKYIYSFFLFLLYFFLSHHFHIAIT